jgi:hypothetical protein
MGLYSLVVIIVMMLAAIVVTQEPKENPKLAKATRQRRGGSYVSPGRRESLATTASTSER